jgi:uncharacterized protein (DUF983 family)
VVETSARQLAPSKPPLPGEPPPLLISSARVDALHDGQPLWSRLRGIVAQRCPVCLGGPLFRSRWRLYDKCTACGHHYHISQGFGRRIMYAVCGILTAAIGVLAFVGMVRGLMALLPRQTGIEPVVLAALGIEQILIAPVYRYMRTLWEHLRLPTRR